jgi:hypothetical protein
VSSVRLRRTAAFAASVATVLALAGCDPIGSKLQTNQPYDAGVGSNHRGGSIDVLNALFVDNNDGTATFSASLLNKDAEPHLLNAATAMTDKGTLIALKMATPRELKPETPFLAGKNGDIILTGKFPAGGFVKLTLDFEDAVPVTINAPVVTRTDVYKDVAVTPGPSETEGG